MLLIRIFIVLIFFAPFGYYYSRLLGDTLGVDYNYLVIAISFLLFLGIIKKINKEEFKFICLGLLVITPFVIGLLWTDELSRGLHYVLILIGTLVLSFVIYKYDVILLMWKSFSYGVLFFLYYTC